MVRYACVISYDGKDFFGSQLQPNLRTVQQEFERCLKNQFQMFVKSSFASRTDKGVHAICQVAHFDLPFEIDPDLITIGLNKRLPTDIRVSKTIKVNPRFHARHDTISKTYRYTILFNDKNVFDFERGTYFHDINIKKFLVALKLFKGKHNFASFTKNDDDKDTIKTITAIKVKKFKSKLDIYISARSFLKYMIRIIIGSCYLYSKDLITKSDLIKGLFDEIRTKFNYTAPAKGLTLCQIIYREFVAV